MWFFLSLTILSLLIKVSAVTFVWKNERNDSLFKVVKLLIIVCVAQSSLELYAYTPLGDIESWISLLFLKSYYFLLLVFILLLLCLTRMLTVGGFNTISLVLGMFYIGLLSVLLFASDLIIADYKLLPYSITRVPGQYYWMFQLTALSSVCFVVYWLVSTMLKASEHIVRAKCANMLIAFIPLAVFLFVIIVLMQLGYEVNAVGLLPLFVSIYLVMIVWNLTSSTIPDYSLLVPGTPKQKLLFKIFKKISTLESEKQPINAEDYQGMLVKYAVEVSRGNQREAAKLLNTSPSTVSRMMRKFSEPE